MNAPLLWFIIPFFFGAFLLLFSESKRLSIILASIVCLFLIAISATVPINSMVIIGKNSIIFTDSMEILGRTLSLERAAQPLLAFFYSYAFIWILFSAAVRVHRFFVPLVLMETALVIGVTAVSPFIYGAFFVQLAVLIALPIFWSEKMKSGEGIIRFLLYQTLGLIFLAIGGWLASAVELNPSDQYILKRTMVVLLVGFIFWLAIFPFHSWIAILMDESCPYLSGFVINILQFSSFLILLYFLKSYLWLRTYDPLFIGLRMIGAIMLIIGSLWAVFQKSVQRLQAFLIVAENGIALFLLGLHTTQSFSVFISLLFIRMIASFFWALAVKSLPENFDFGLNSLQGLYRSDPFISLTLIVSYFSTVGLPFLPGFPYQATFLQLAFSESSSMGTVLSIGYWLLIAAGFRLAVTLLHPAEKAAGKAETANQRALLIIGIAALFLITFFPEPFNRFIAQIQSQFTLISGG
ncbi:MAG TPA: proton-conducting transporter membrane subunit [Flexilinea sp.]|nr:proton-conducting transporter membrane subunit [Flexilinea sp.]HQF80279.1 proton-conducting transporter membrane subunit [Flexilinea sp.]